MTRCANGQIGDDEREIAKMRKTTDSHMHNVPARASIPAPRPQDPLLASVDVEGERWRRPSHHCSDVRARSSPPPPALGHLTSAPFPKPGLLGGAGSVDLDTPRAYLPERVEGALGAVLRLQFNFSCFPGAASLAAGAGPSGERASNDVAKYLDSMSPSQELPARSPLQRTPLPGSGVSSSERAGTGSAFPRVPPLSTERPIPVTFGHSGTDYASAPAAVAAEATATETAAAPFPGTERAILPTTPSEERAARGVPAADRARSGSATPSLASVYEARARAAAASAAKGRAAGGRARTCAEGAQSGEDVQSVDSGTGGEGREEGRSKRMVEKAKNKLHRRWLVAPFPGRVVIYLTSGLRETRVRILLLPSRDRHDLTKSLASLDVYRSGASLRRHEISSPRRTWVMIWCKLSFSLIWSRNNAIPSLFLTFGFTLSLFWITQGNRRVSHGNGGDRITRSVQLVNLEGCDCRAGLSMTAQSVRKTSRSAKWTLEFALLEQTTRAWCGLVYEISLVLGASIEPGGAHASWRTFTQPVLLAFLAVFGANGRRMFSPSVLINYGKPDEQCMRPVDVSG
ncbi:hypothetical protein DFH11DRAFT_1548490 [Phellopilus nigrolimitatus]|nr:hypothetical protein DFH11DRAFT_1548490 [Phellopilus nigrolimitatus]